MIYLSPKVSGDSDAASDQNLRWGFNFHHELLALPVPGESIQDLHDAMDALGLVVKWFRKAPYPHYRISQSHRAKAKKLGAVMLSDEEFKAIKNG